MGQHLFLKDKDIPSSVKHIMQELKVLINQRSDVNATRRSRSNVTHIDARENERRLEVLIRQYQRLSRPVARYFLKYGDAITFRLYVEFKNELDAIKDDYDTKGKDISPSVTKTTKVAQLSDYREEVKIDRGAKSEDDDGDGKPRGNRLTERLRHLQVAVNELLDGHLDADAVDHLLKHGNLTQCELGQLLNYIQSKKASLGEKPTQEASESHANSLGLGSSGEGEPSPEMMQEMARELLQGNEAEEDTGLVSQSEESHGKEAEPQKQMAFGRSYREKLERLESKILRALNQKQFNPSPML